MKNIRRFGRTGVHPPEMKLTAGSPIKDMPLPRRVEISLAQSLGRPAAAVVKPGDHVSRFDLIGEAQGAVSANVHTPISGTVKSVGPIDTPDGHGATGVIIEASDSDHACDLQSICDATPLIPPDGIGRLSPQEITDTIRRAGIVGLGGATFPTATKLSPPPGSPRCEFLLINGAECEPYLTCDDAIMREMPGEIITGIEIMLRALGDDVRCIVGIEDNKPQAISEMTVAARSNSRITVMPMRTRYPQGGEKMLVKALTGRSIAPGALPISEGVIIQNVATALAVYHAVVWGMPLVERVMTVSGKDCQAAGNYRVPVGTPLKDIVGPLPDTTVRIVSGGTMMGRALAGIQGSTTKGMSGLLLLNSQEAPLRDTTPCVRCGRCVEVCPMGLEPYLLAKLSQLGRIDDAAARHVADCMECGCCSYSCMAGRPLVDWIKVGKSMARQR